MDFDEGGIFYSDQRRGDAELAEGESPMTARIKYREFIRTFRDGETFVYRDALRQAVSLNAPVVQVDLDHVMAWDDALADDLLQRPGFHLPLFEAAALEAALSMAIVDETAQEDLPAFQITLTSSKQPSTIRQLLSSQVSRVVMIPGIVISSSKVKARPGASLAERGVSATARDEESMAAQLDRNDHVLRDLSLVRSEH